MSITEKIYSIITSFIAISLAITTEYEGVKYPSSLSENYLSVNNHNYL